MDYGGYKDKGVQIYKNQEQEFLLEKQVRNIWYSLYQEAWNWREREARKGEITRVECVKCGKRNVIMRKVSEQERREILCPKCRVKRKREW